MNYTKQELENIMKKHNGNLDLSDTDITSLPDNFTVGGWLDLSDTDITSLPDNLTVGGKLYLTNTAIPYDEKIKIQSKYLVAYARKKK